MDSSAKSAPRTGTVYIVDDDDLLRPALARIVDTAGWRVRPCESGDAFLRQVEEIHPSCVVLDLFMPGKDGVEVQRELIRRSIDIPIIFLSGEGTISIATNALLNGAMDFLVKPFEPSVLLERVEAAMKEDLRRVELAAELHRVRSLTERETEICELLARGLGSKQIAQELSISDRTVEHHRERILRKTETSNTAELASLYTRALSSGTNRASNAEPGQRPTPSPRGEDV